jgi:hypothetical protein
MMAQLLGMGFGAMELDRMAQMQAAQVRGMERYGYASMNALAFANPYANAYSSALAQQPYRPTGHVCAYCGTRQSHDRCGGCGAPR